MRNYYDNDNYISLFANCELTKLGAKGFFSLCFHQALQDQRQGSG